MVLTITLKSWPSFDPFSNVLQALKDSFCMLWKRTTHLVTGVLFKICKTTSLLSSKRCLSLSPSACLVSSLMMLLLNLSSGSWLIKFFQSGRHCGFIWTAITLKRTTALFHGYTMLELLIRSTGLMLHPYLNFLHLSKFPSCSVYESHFPNRSVE